MKHSRQFNLTCVYISELLWFLTLSVVIVSERFQFMEKMLNNKDLSEMYLNSNKSKEHVFRLVSAAVPGTDEVIHRIVDNWIKRFSRRFPQGSSKKKFFQNNEKWLNMSFMPEDDLVSPHISENIPGHSGSSCPGKRRGRKRLRYEDLSESVKDKRSRFFSKEPLDKLLRSAEKAAHHNSSPAIAKLLYYLRTQGEEWASEQLKLSKRSEKLHEPSVEDSLLLKTRLSLSKSKYQGVEKFVRQEYGIKALQPWQNVMEHRNNILPIISPVSGDNGYLSVHVNLRDMVFKDVSRMLELHAVKSEVSALCDGENPTRLDCILHLTAGVDSATGFSHYNQGDNVGKDDSLLSEHVMCLMLEANGERLWTNPNPQSDVFCQARSMAWVKETDIITKQLYSAFFEEVENICENPVIISTENGELSVTVSAMYSLVDGKAANAIVGNRNTHACPSCVSGADPRVGPSFFHSRLNTVEWLIRIAAQKAVDGHPAQAHAAVKKKAREIADQLEKCFGMNINRPKIGGSGSSNNGNMARLLLADPKNFSRILGVSQTLIENIRLLSCLALSSNQLNDQKVEELYTKTEKLIRKEFDFVKQLPPCFHKYSHMGALIRILPFPLSFIDEQAGERCHKRYKHARTHLARKTSPEDNLLDMMRLSLAWSDIKLSYQEFMSSSTQHHRSTDSDFVQMMTFYHADQQSSTEEAEFEHTNNDESESEVSDYISDESEYDF